LLPCYVIACIMYRRRLAVKLKKVCVFITLYLKNAEFARHCAKQVVFFSLYIFSSACKPISRRAAQICFWTLTKYINWTKMAICWILWRITMLFVSFKGLRKKAESFLRTYLVRRCILVHWLIYFYIILAPLLLACISVVMISLVCNIGSGQYFQIFSFIQKLSLQWLSTKLGAWRINPTNYLCPIFVKHCFRNVKQIHQLFFLNLILYDHTYNWIIFKRSGTTDAKYIYDDNV